MDNEKEKAIVLAGYKQLDLLAINYLNFVFDETPWKSELPIPKPYYLKELLLKGLTPYSRNPLLGDFPNILENEDVTTADSAFLGNDGGVTICWEGFSDGTMIGGDGCIYLHRSKDKPGYIIESILNYNYDDNEYSFYLDGKRPITTIKELWNFIDWMYDPEVPHEDFPRGQSETEDYKINIEYESDDDF